MAEEVKQEVSSLNLSQTEIKLIKLSNDDLLIAQLNENSYDEEVLLMIEPILIQTHQLLADGKLFETYSLKPWIPLTDDLVLEVPYSKIMNISYPTEAIVERYMEFLYDEPEEMLEDDQEDSEQIQDSEELEELLYKFELPKKKVLH